MYKLPYTNHTKQTGTSAFIFLPAYIIAPEKLLFWGDKKKQLIFYFYFWTKIYVVGSHLVGLELNSPVNTIKVMLSRSVYLTQTFSWAGLVLWLTCTYFFARNWQLLFLNQRKGENNHRKYFMINLHERTLLDLAEIKSSTSWSPIQQTSPVGWASDRASEAGSKVEFKIPTYVPDFFYRQMDLFPWHLL